MCWSLLLSNSQSGVYVISPSRNTLAGNYRFNYLVGLKPSTPTPGSVYVQ